MSRELARANERGFDCGSGSYCSIRQRTQVKTGGTTGPRGGRRDVTTPIFHRTKTTITEGKATTEVYILSDDKWVKAATTTDGGKTYTFNEDTREDGTKIVGDGVRQSLASGGDMNKNVNNQISTTLRSGGQTNETRLSDEQITQTGAVDSNSANTDDPSGAGGQELVSGIEEELEKGFKENTREKYDPDIRYPLNLKIENQDCIKFSIIKYIPPKLGESGQSQAGSRIVKLRSDKPGIGDRDILGTITLPIPAGINDRNSADWQNDTLDEITKAFSDISMQTILRGGEGLVESVGSQAGRATQPGSGLAETIASRLVQAATGASNIISRQFGAVLNPNLELLFNGPSLRSFTFNFRFTPREKKEAQAVRKIIRYFKQAMSVKRSQSSLLLKAPHTFAISYLSNNTDHPYLNRFKECALTDCSVNYTPDGTYMTYGDSSMTAYELSLTFQELEPIFDDEYFEIDKNQDTSIGF